MNFHTVVGKALKQGKIDASNVRNKKRWSAMERAWELIYGTFPGFPKDMNQPFTIYREMSVGNPERIAREIFAGERKPGQYWAFDAAGSGTYMQGGSEETATSNVRMEAEVLLKDIDPAETVIQNFMNPDECEAGLLTLDNLKLVKVEWMEQVEYEEGGEPHDVWHEIKNTDSRNNLAERRIKPRIMKNRAQNGGDLTLYHSTTAGNGEGLRHSALEQIGHTYGRAWYPTLTDSMKGAIYWTKNYTVPMVVVEYALPPAAQKKYLLPSTLDVKTYPIETYGTMYALNEPLPSKYFVKLHPVKKIAPRKSKWIVLKKTGEEKESVKFSDEWYKVLGYVDSDSAAESIKNDRQSKLERIYVVMLSYLRERFGDAIANKVSKKANTVGEYDPGKQNQAMYPVQSRAPEIEKVIKNDEELKGRYNEYVAFCESNGLNFFDLFTIDTRSFKPEDKNELEDRMYAAAQPDVERKLLIAYHVTDDPRVMDTLTAGRSLLKTSKTKVEDVGPGFYASNYIEYWIGRSLKRYDPIKKLDKSQRLKVYDYLKHELLERRTILDEAGKEMLKENLDNYLESGEFWRIDYVFTPPISIKLKKIIDLVGVEPYDPYIVEIEVVGKFFDMMRKKESKFENLFDDIASTWLFVHYPREKMGYLAYAYYRFLNDFGFAGILQRGKAFSSPQIVIWKPKAIVKATLTRASKLKHLMDQD
jgi:hypothetical protein